MALSDIGRPEVLRAVEEFDRLGRSAFLHRYGFQASRTYLLSLDGRYYDSKAVVGAAHGYVRGQRPLAASEFSGGRGHAVKRLDELGFQVVCQEAVAPEAAPDDLVGRIARLRVAHTRTGPLLYQPITLLWAIGRAVRGEPRMLPWEETSAALSGLLEEFGLRGERVRPGYPVLALHHAGLWTLQGHEGPVPPAHGAASVPHRWFAAQQPTGGPVRPFHDLMRTSGQARVEVIQTLTDRFFADLDEIPLLRAVGLYDESVADDLPRAPESSPVPAVRAEPADPVSLAAQYERLCGLVERREASRRGRRRESVSRDPIRSSTARRAVLLRSAGRCENAACGGQPDDVTDSGDPILEVDHVVEITGDGRDHPSQMIALCPNCHAVKTRGRSRHQVRAAFLDVVRELHARARGTRG
ncbi:MULTISPECIES: HNH endonuclease signature motif containing protein [Streptomyces]|uniref:HNH endonuclease signature motif containing protein n=2 Tax=Streptomyces TaxID=1883 RepID=UPI001E3000D2|nr:MULTISPECIES: HNH endonuclease signature motif containing protein [Streptomyces]UFQ17690.1 HNH endonuclease [Streptomyces huasconensis]WCL87297.1 HNH endonuclease signature motif containing protein [Streptomyces sp. JCM 35825]